MPRSSEKYSEVIFLFQAKRRGVAVVQASEVESQSQYDYATCPLQLLRRRIEDDGAAYRRKTEVLIRIKNKIKMEFFEEASCSLGRQRLENG